MFQTQEPEGQQETRLPFPSMESRLYKSTLGPALLGPSCAPAPHHVMLPLCVCPCVGNGDLQSGLAPPLV